MGSESQGEQTRREGFMGCAFLSIELYLLHFIMILVSVLPTPAPDSCVEALIPM